MKWEYKTISEKQFNKRKIIDVEARLNVLGDDEWELVSLYKGIVIFKRPKAEPA